MSNQANAAKSPLVPADKSPAQATASGYAAAKAASNTSPSKPLGSAPPANQAASAAAGAGAQAKPPSTSTAQSKLVQEESKVPPTGKLVAGAPTATAQSKPAQVASN